MTQVNTVFFDHTTEGTTARVTVAHYTANEVIEPFLVLFNCMDFKDELAELGIGRFQFKRRKRALREFRAFCIALWGLALQKSFPKDAEAFFAEFRSVAPCLVGKDPECILLQSRVGIYVDLLALKKDADFLPVATYLAEVLALDADDMARLRLKISLIMRTLYTMIFNRLV